MKFAWVAIGGALGAMSRYGLGVCFQTYFLHRTYLLIAIVNLLGSFLMGFGVSKMISEPWVRLLFLTGFLGSFTTFSTFSLDLWSMVEKGFWWKAFSNVLIQVIFGTVLVGLGFWLGQKAESLV